MRGPGRWCARAHARARSLVVTKSFRNEASSARRGRTFVLLHWRLRGDRAPRVIIKHFLPSFSDYRSEARSDLSLIRQKIAPLVTLKLAGSGSTVEGKERVLCDVRWFTSRLAVRVEIVLLFVAHGSAASLCGVAYRGRKIERLV